MAAEAFPLQWPDGWHRDQNPQASKFQTGLVQARKGLMRQLDLLGAENVVISSNAVLTQDGEIAARQPKIEDTGIAVYFTLHGEHRAIPCDKWIRLEDNVHAIELTIEALRGLDRWGAKETVDAAFRGFAALPAGTTTVQEGWWTTLEVEPTAGLVEIDAAFKRLVKVHHPDGGGNDVAFKRLMDAYRLAKAS